MNWEIEDYSETVQAGINRWPVGIRAYYAKVTERMLVFGPNLGMLFTKSFGKGLFEIRAIGKEGIGMAFFCVCVGYKIVILHEFIKKTRKTPSKKIAVARKRLLKVTHENKKKS